MPHSQGLSNQSTCETLCDIPEQRWFLEMVVNLTPPSWRTSPGAIHYCLFNIFAANLNSRRSTPLSATQGHAPCSYDRKLIFQEKMFNLYQDLTRGRPISIYFIFLVFTTKPISLQALNNTSAFLCNVMTPSPIKFTSSA